MTNLTIVLGDEKNDLAHQYVLECANKLDADDGNLETVLDEVT